MSVDWAATEYFTASEFASPDAPDTGDLIQPELVERLDDLRARCGFPLIIASGYRTSRHNKFVGGVDSSAHTKGFAVDVRCTESSKRFVIVREATASGFNRIGISSTFIHLDCDPQKAKDVMWTY